MSTTRRITFEAFMRAALHDPERGYYARHIRAVGGARGDFTTAPMRAGDLLARAIARWAAAAMRRTGCRNLIEIGPGEGELMRGVLHHLPWHIRLRTRAHLVETSPVLAGRQQSTLRRRRVAWHTTPADAIHACGGRAILFSNELVDAFPVRIFQKSAHGWHELAIEIDASGRVLREVLLDPDPAALPDSSSFAMGHPDGQRIEVHAAYQAWLTHWLPAWRAGEMLTIDYGDHASTLYRRRPAGTLRAYLMHQRLGGAAIYQNIGLQDLTADVNFTDLADWAAPWCASQPVQTLATFLAQYQKPRSMVESAKSPSEIDPAKALADADHAGGAFKTLRQSPSPQSGAWARS